MIVDDILKTDPAEDGPPPIFPERGLLAGVINHAFLDACQKTNESQKKDSVAFDAVDFLMGKRSDPYFELININANAAREALVKKTAYLPEYEKFRYWLRFWNSGIPLNALGKIPAGRRAA